MEIKTYSQKSAKLYDNICLNRETFQSSQFSLKSVENHSRTEPRLNYWLKLCLYAVRYEDDNTSISSPPPGFCNNVIFDDSIFTSTIITEVSVDQFMFNLHIKGSLVQL